MKRAFTLLELIVVILIIGILGSLGFSQFQIVIEKGKTAEGVRVLGDIRKAQEAYYLEYGNYTATLTNLNMYATKTDLSYFTFNVKAINGWNGVYEDFYALARVRRGATDKGASSPHPYGTYALDIDTNGTIICLDWELGGSPDGTCKKLGFKKFGE